MSAQSLSPKLREVLEKRIKDRETYNKNPITGDPDPFRFILEGTGVVDNSVSPPRIIFRDAYLDAKTTVYDPYDAKKPSKIVRNVVSTEPRSVEKEDGSVSEVLVEVTEPVHFLNGYCLVHTHEINKLAYLMFGAGNMSKPKQLMRTGDKPLIRWTEDGKTLYTAKSNTEIGEIRLLAKALEVAQRADITRMKAVLSLVSKEDKYSSYEPSNKNYDAIQNDFFVFARNNPKAFLDANVDDKTKVEVLVTETQLKGILVNDTEKACWMISFRSSPTKFMPYNKVTTVNPEVELINFLLDVKNEAKLNSLIKMNKPRLHPYLPDEEPKAKVSEDVLELAD